MAALSMSRMVWFNLRMYVFVVRISVFIRIIVVIRLGIILFMLGRASFSNLSVCLVGCVSFWRFITNRLQPFLFKVKLKFGGAV